MNKLINTIGIIVLFGILIKLSYVFVYLFSELDAGSLVSRITGVTFAFASVWFVVKVEKQWLKLTVILLDMSTILYFYLHSLFEIPVEYAAVIVSAYSGLIVYYVGRIVNEQINSVHDRDTDSLRNELTRLRTDIEKQRIKQEIKLVNRRISETRNPATKQLHQNNLDRLEKELKELK